MQAIEKLALKGPLKLRMVEVAWMHFEIIGMYGDVRVLEVDDDFNSFTFSTRRKIK